MGRVTTAVYKGVHEDSEPPRNALRQAAQFLKQLLTVDRLAAVQDSTLASLSGRGIVRKAHHHVVDRVRSTAHGITERRR